jgi:ribosomal protein S4
MSADATSRTRIVKPVSRWSQSGHGDARSDNCSTALSTAPTSQKAIVIGAQTSQSLTNARLDLTVARLPLASTVNTAIKSP